MKLPPSTYFSKLLSDLLPELGRSTLFGRMLFGTLFAFSLLVSVYHFQVMEQPFFNNHDASAQSYTSPLFASPGTDDFLSYAVAIMPTVQGANLDTSNIAGSTNCDLLVPVTYIDAGCMNSLPLLFPFEQQQSNFTEPINQTLIYSNFSNGSALDLSIGVASENITAGETQTVTVSVSDQNSTEPIAGALVLANVTDSFDFVLHEYEGTSDEVGQVSFPFLIPTDAVADIYNVAVQATADGYENASASTTFEVVGSDFFFDNSTTDEFFDDGSSSSDDNCCSSDNNNDDFNSPTVKSTDPSDGDNNVPTDLSEIKVTFDESIDKNSVDTGSLFIFANNCGNVFCNDPNIQDVSVSGKSATFTIDNNDRLSPNTNYIASISSSIEDQDGNFLDCFDSNAVDSNCEWDFSTSGSSLSTTISLNPTSGPVGSTVTITGTGFDPDSTVTITFGGTALGTVTTNSNGGFSATFIVPLSSSSEDHTVTATQGSNSASKTFTVTSSTIPTITLNPTSGPVGTSVTVTGINFVPSTPVTITFDGNAVTTTPPAVTADSNGKFTATITVPVKLSGAHTIAANSASKTFTVTPSTIPTIVLDPTSGPVDTLVNVTGIGFDPNAAIIINFDGNPVDTIPPTVIANSNGEFSATFTVPDPSSNGPHEVLVTQGDNSALQTFNVTPTLFSSLSAKSQSNVSPFGAPTNQSNATLVPPSSNQSNASVPIGTNSSFDTAESNGNIPLENNTPSLNASSTLGTENTSTAPSAKELNNTSLDASTDNTINNNPPATVSTQNNDTSNSKSSEKSPISPPTSNDQLTPTTLTKDNTTNEIAQNESNNPLSDAKVKNNDISSKDSETVSSDSETEKPSSVTDDKTITKVTSPDSDNQPETQSGSTDSIKRDRALFFKYLNSNNDNVKEEDKPEVNNRPVAINDKASTEANIPVSINILRNDKDSDGDKLSMMGLSPPLKGSIESNPNGMITYSPSESWSGTERFGYSVSDGRGGVATASVTVIVQPSSVENQPPESQDQDVTVNANSPVKIKLGAKDPDDGKLRFELVSKPSHGRIVQFSSSTGTLAYVPDQNYDGKDDFAFKVHDGTVFSKDAKVSIKIEMNEKLSRDQVQQNDKQQPNRQQSSQTPTDEEKPADDKSNNNDTPPSDSSDQSSSPTQDAEQQKSDVKEEQQPSDSEKSTSDTAGDDSQPTTNS